MKRQDAREAVYVEAARRWMADCDKDAASGQNPNLSWFLKREIERRLLSDPSPRADALLAVVEAARNIYPSDLKVWAESESKQKRIRALHDALARLDGRETLK